MGAEEKNRNEVLSRLAADLFVKSEGGEQLSSKTRRLRDELKKVIGSEDTIFGKVNGLVESFREIIPDETQRFNAAVKALSATSKMSRQEIVKAVNSQLDELKILEKGLIPSWRDEFSDVEAKERELRDEIAKLRERLGRLESEEKELLSDIASREKEMEPVEKAVKEIFSDIGADITYIRKMIEESESAASSPIPPPASAKSDIPSVKKNGEQKKEIPASVVPQETQSAAPQETLLSPAPPEITQSPVQEIPEPPAPQRSEWRKKCPMCGGQMDFHIERKVWICFSCAYEEKGDEVQEKNKGTSEIQESPAPQEISQSSAPQESKWQKKCPMCGGQMNFHLNEEKWVCYSCAYEESEEGRDKSEKKSEQNASQPAPAEPTFDSAPPSTVTPESLPTDRQEPLKGSIPESSPPKNQPTKKKTCPVCRKKMEWQQIQKAWRCPFCQYERRI